MPAVAQSNAIPVSGVANKLNEIVGKMSHTQLEDPPRKRIVIVGLGMVGIAFM